MGGCPPFLILKNTSMRVLGIVGDNVSSPNYSFMCPGCHSEHFIWTGRPGYTGPVWSFNFDVDRPTFNPSLLVRVPEGDKMNTCHSFIRDGRIQFLDDCTHSLKGQTVDLPDLSVV